MAQAQALIVLGTPIPCDRSGCDEPAVVYLREQENDGEPFGVCYCEMHWQAMRRAFAPLTPHDAAEAVREAASLMEGGQ